MKKNYFFVIYLRSIKKTNSNRNNLALRFICTSQKKIVEAPLQEALTLLKDLCNRTKGKYVFDYDKHDIIFYLQEGFVEEFLSNQLWIGTLTKNNF